MSKYYKAEDVIRKRAEDLADTSYWEYGNPKNVDDWIEVAEMEFKDLPTIEVSEDCISREQVRAKLDYISYAEKDPISIAKRIVEDAPSVTTEQYSMVGEWQITDAYPHNVYCSECHKKFAQTHWAVWEDDSLPRNYCPNCGAKMKGAEE